MKKIKKLLIVLMCVSCISTPVNAQAITKSQTTTNVKTAAKPSGLAVNKARNGITNWKKPPKKGWYTLKNGKKRYYRKSKYIKGLKKLGSYRYFFSMKNGVMATKDTTYKKTTYFIDEKGHVQGWKKGTRYYNADSRRMTYDQIQEFCAYRNAQKIVEQVTNEKMSKEQKLEACFRWTVNHQVYTWRRFVQGGNSWWASFANDIFERGSGNCTSFSGAFAYCAKVLGYTEVYICTSGPRTVEASHAWVEINGLAYESYWARIRAFEKCYAVPYEEFKREPYMRIKLS